MSLRRFRMMSNAIIRHIFDRFLKQLVQQNEITDLLRIRFDPERIEKQIRIKIRIDLPAV